MTTDRKVTWTQQQERAIRSRGGNIMVAASAGTGKTAVLSGRCVGLVAEGGVDLDILNMLVLTFTEAAAEQMKARIAQQLRDAFRERRDARLGRQLVLLQGADIRTIHSFCKQLIGERFHELSLDPALRVIDGDEAMLLKTEVLEQTVGWAWRQPHLAGGLRSLLGRRDLRETGGFLDGVIRLGDFLDGVVLPDRWCDLADRLAQAADPSSSELGRAQQRIIEERLKTILAQLRQAKALCETLVPGSPWGNALAEQIIAPAAECLRRLTTGDWQSGADMIQEFDRPKAPPLRNLSGVAADILKDLRKKALDELTGLRELAVVNPEYLDVVGRSAGSQTRVLIELIRKFRRLYGERKRVVAGLDFADLERYTLKLLTVEDPSSGRLEPSETALTLRNRYRHILVDEYQDINAVQQAILDALSTGNNLFGVGDVKQSIYGWRGAEPTIFLKRLTPASKDPKDTVQDLRVDLNYNFRSAKGILDFVNAVFRRIMTSTVANIDYDEAAHLRPGPQGDSVGCQVEPGRPLVEFHVLDETAAETDTPNEDSQEDRSEVSESIVRSRQRQAMMIAQRIRRIVGADTGRSEFQIYDKEAGALRDVEYRDVVVLLRSLAKKANDYVEIFRLAGIPVNCDATAGYFEATEITDVLCLLKVLDNPHRDIELAAVLRSPLFGLRDTDLARIRLHGRERSAQGGFYGCVRRYRGDGSDAALRSRLATILDTLARWRSLARRGSLADLLWSVYRETCLIPFVCSLPNGQTRKANLLKLHDRAIQFEGFASNTGFASLTRFVDFLERLQEAGQDWAPAQPGSAAVNAVRILSVHKSKGLEFPVVFLAELETGFNLRDIHSDLIADTSDAVGLQVIDRQSNTRLRSLPHQVIGEKKLAAALAEEMRILYVATTRARDRLILTASQKRTNCGKVLAQGLLLGGDTVPDWLLKSCHSALEWVLYGLADQRALHEAFATGLADRTRDDRLFDLRLYGAQDLAGLSQSVLAMRTSKGTSAFFTRTGPSGEPAGKEMLSRLKERLDWRYPFSGAVHLSAKSSVTRLTHQDDLFVQRDYSEALDRQPVGLIASGVGISGPRLARPAGTAAHLVVSSLDLKQPVTLRVIEQTRDQLVGEGAIPEKVAGEIDVQAIFAFFAGELGAIVCDKRHTVWQEWPFTFGLPACESYDTGEPRSGTGGEIIVVQGLIDLLVQTSEGLIVIDLKTDRVSGDEVAGRAEVYRGQLDLYAKAAAAIRRESVHERWLYFLAARQAVQV